ncbi:hypothetical protein [Nesterenkonia flava]|uniref:Uncharacterized protein n=1 Tax=Nesterenkonia flava TaxID=469799 RepID=A0ABU1FRY5_9MICC|nr:hypothetical protein [Nesterenkonia flava]MDR5711432.1 hypothetical protein [Nesterenkonia flava]
MKSTEPSADPNLTANEGTIQVIMSPKLGESKGMAEPELEVDPTED